MKLRKVNYKEVRGTRKTKAELDDFIQEFVESREKCMEIDVTEYASANSAIGSIRKAVLRSKRNLELFQREGKVYIANKAL